MSILATALLCSLTIAAADCDRSNAIDILVLGTADSELQCLMYAPMTLASLAIQPRPGERWIIKCSSSNVGSGANVG